LFALGVKLPEYDTKGNNPDSLCALCPEECKADGNYSNYDGAFRCMDDGVGDVAFVKHTTVRDNAAMPTDYQYLCKDGKRMGRYSIFTLATVTSMVRCSKLCTLRVFYYKGATLFY